MMVTEDGMEEVKTEFKWSELSEEARQRATENYFTPAGEWAEFILTDFREDMKMLNVDITNVNYSGFWSQGDGASWTGDIDVKAYLCRTYPDDLKRMVLLQAMEEDWVGTRLYISSTGRYYNEGAMDIDEISRGPTSWGVFEEPGIFQGANIPERLVAFGWHSRGFVELEKEVLEWARTKARELYKNLDAEYEYQTSDEYLADLCEANEYVFDEDGNLN
jgi:hypothetical protein